MAFRNELRSDISPSWAFLRRCFVSEVLQNGSGMVGEYPGLSECTDERRGTPFCTRQVPACCATTQHKVKLFVGNFHSFSGPNSPFLEEMSWLYGDWQEPTDCVLLVTKSIGYAARVTTEKAAIYCWTWQTTTAVNGRLLCKDTTFEPRATTGVGRHLRNSQLCLPS